MNKKSIFIVTNIFFVSLILLTNSYSIIHFKSDFSYSFVLFGLILIYFIISKPLADELFDTKVQLKDKMQQTIHEINTPVATIQMNVEMLSQNIHEKKDMKRLQIIEMACDNLLQLYSDMEYYIKQEIEDIHIEHFDLEKQIQLSLKKQESFLEASTISIKLDVHNYHLYADKIGFERTIDNLISNAIKHNQTITTLWIYTREDILCIKDDGEGIKSQNIYAIFDKYYKSSEDTKGLGLGLHIVKKFCDNNDINIKIDSSNQGSIFSLSLENILAKKEL